MSIFVFLGPSLPLSDARDILDAIYLPPVRHGDVWRAAAFGEATAIGIIDGYFERVPAVWHKEILWALSQGVAVAGAASMGALRAAELTPFGMVGVGDIFRAYRDGVLPPYDGEPFEDDDEVAVVHAPAEANYLASDAMVNIRVTLTRATEEGVIDAPTRDRLASIAKSMFYKDRSYANLIECAERDLDLRPATKALREWLPGGRVDQKRQDAIQLLHWLRDYGNTSPECSFVFERTTIWEKAVAGLARSSDDERVLTEFRLEGATYLLAIDGASQRVGTAASDDDESPFTLPSGDPDAALACLDERARRLSTVLAIRRFGLPLYDQIVLNDARRDGRYEPLLARARAKAEALASIGRDQPELGDVDLTPDQLLAWFATRLGAHGSISEVETAALLRFDGVLAFWRAVAAEYLFQHFPSR